MKSLRDKTCFADFSFTGIVFRTIPVLSCSSFKSLIIIVQTVLNHGTWVERSFYCWVSLFLLNPDPPQFKQLRETSETQHLCPLNPTYRAGMTSNLVRRIWQHKNNITRGFTKRYNGREVAKTNTPILLVFLSVFCVATMHEYYNMHPLSRLEYEQKFYVIQVYYFLRIP